MQSEPYCSLANTEVPAMHEIRVPVAARRHAAAPLPCAPLPCVSLACSIATQEKCEDWLLRHAACYFNPAAEPSIEYLDGSTTSAPSPPSTAHEETPTSTILKVRIIPFYFAILKYLPIAHRPLSTSSQYLDHHGCSGSFFQGIPRRIGHAGRADEEVPCC